MLMLLLLKQNFGKHLLAQIKFTSNKFIYRCRQSLFQASRRTCANCLSPIWNMSATQMARILRCRRKKSKKVNFNRIMWTTDKCLTNWLSPDNHFHTYHQVSQTHRTCINKLQFKLGFQHFAGNQLNFKLLGTCMRILLNTFREMWN